jgi:hypothetical protein
LCSPGISTGPRFLRIQELSPRNVLHAFRLASAADIDAEFVTWLAEAYRVGAQEHLHPDKHRPAARADTPTTAVLGAYAG